MTSSDSQISESTTQDYTGNVSERMTHNETLTSSKSMVHCNTARVRNSSLLPADALNERPCQNTIPSAPVTESMIPNSTETTTAEDYTNAPKNGKSIPPTTHVKIFSNSTETTTVVVHTIQRNFTSSTISNTTNSTNASTNASARAYEFWLSKMTPNRSSAGTTTTTVQWDVSSRSDGITFIYLLLYFSTALPYGLFTLTDLDSDPDSDSDSDSDSDPEP